MDDFKAFPKIENMKRMYMEITQKIHGTNAQILIEDISPLKDMSMFSLKAGSRTRWLTPEDDNHGFCKWVEDNRNELGIKLGEGRHYGEWCGKGINVGEGLPDKRFVLFNWHRFKDKPLPDRVMAVPVLYVGQYSNNQINEEMDKLKEKGSRLVSGFMKPEGIVIKIGGEYYKKVFEEETIAWSKSDKPTWHGDPLPDVSHLLQPLRLEKLLGRDEKYRREYPANLRDIASAYFDDLSVEGQLAYEDEMYAAIKKSLGKQLYKFIRYHMEELHDTNDSHL